MPGTPTRQAGALLPALAAAGAFALVFLADTWRAPLVTTPLLFALLALAALRPRAAGGLPAPARVEVRVAGVVALAWLCVLAHPGTRVQGLPILPPAGAVPGSFVVAFAVALLLALRPPPPAVALGLLLVAALALRRHAPEVAPLDPAVRDMLPLVVRANRTLLEGGNPYAIHAMQAGSQVPLTYPPLLWLAHLPAVALDLDVRGTLVACDVAVALGLGVPALRSGPRGRLVLVGLAAYLFSPDTHWNGVYAEPHVAWAVTALLLGAILSRRPLWIGAALGLGLLTRPFHVVLAPLVLVWLVRASGSRRALRAALLAGAIAAAGYLPFVLRDPPAFFLGTVTWLLHYGPAHADWFHGALGFTGPLYEAGAAAWQTRAQALVVGAGLLGAALLARSTRGLLGVLLFTYAGFVAFNPLLWMSFWIPVGLVAVALAAAGDDRAATPRVHWGDGPRWRAGLELAGAAGVLLAGGVLVGEYLAYRSTAGRDDAARALRASVAPGDLVVDRTGPRLAFLDTPPLVPESALPEGVRVAGRFARALSGAPLEPGRAERVWTVDRPPGRPRDGPLRDGVLYAERHVERHGRYRLALLERRPARHLGDASAGPGPFDARLVADGGATVEGRPDGAGGTGFDGFPAWTTVRRQRVRIDGTRVMIGAHPVDGYTTVVRWRAPAGATHALVTAGLDERAVVWGHAPVRLVVARGDRVAARAVLPNLPGLRATAVPVASGEVLEVRISAARSGLRHVAFDVSWFGE